MGDADTALTTKGLVPIGIAGDGGAQRGEQADEDCDVGGGDPAMASLE